MEKIIVAIFLALISTLGKPLFAQDRQEFHFGHSFFTEESSTDTRFMYRQTAMTQVNDDAIEELREMFIRKSATWDVISDKKPKSPLILAVKLDPSLTNFWGAEVQSISKGFSTYTISNGSEAILVSMGIDSSNYRDYRYRVIRNDSEELVHWAIPMLEKNYNAKKEYGFIGKFCCPGSYLAIEVVNIRNYALRDGVIFDWRTDFKPTITQMTVMMPNNNYFNIHYTKLNHGYATKYDLHTGLPQDFHFPVDSVEAISFDFSPHEAVVYVIRLLKTIDGKTDTTLLKWWTQDKNYELEKKDFQKPGKYEMQILRAMDIDHPKEDQMLRLPFEVQPPPQQKTVSLKQLLPFVLGAIAAIGLAFFLYHRASRARLRKARRQNETIGLQLKSIQSQLNPHFMFNALAAIQGLMNRNDIDGANHYLAKFAGLTRKVLLTSEWELISLEDEWAMQETYLQMEQLRFGFQYSVTADPSVDLANTEIPVMLLQPFVENAVKHGVASLGQKGEIRVHAEKTDGQLVLTVKDNGAGFDKEKSANATSAPEDQGFGLRLSAKRIVLLNQRYKTPWVSLDISSGTTGTSVTLRINQDI
ncbi:MAG: histidine kinase [Luteolibacter sp.]